MEKQLKSIKFPGLDDVYVIPETNNKADNIQVKSGSVITTDNSAHTPLKGLKLFGKTTQNGTPTPDAPVPLESVGDSGSISVTVCGKNLLNLVDKDHTAVGCTGVVKNGVVTVTGTVTGSSYTLWLLGGYDSTEVLFTLPIGTYTVKDCVLYSFDGATRVNKTGTFTVTEPFAVTGVLYKQYAVGTVINETAYPQVENGSVATAFEPFKGKTLTISTPNGLPGIPVSSGGNYTDENGQMWICDEIDFARGKYVQRVRTRAIDMKSANIQYVSAASGDTSYYYNIPNGFESAYMAKQSQKMLCDIFQSNEKLYSNTTIEGCTGTGTYFSIRINANRVSDTTAEALRVALPDSISMLYQLKTPIETDLTPEELAAYAAMHTNYPNTTIFNDCAAHMKVKYYTPNTAVQMVHSPADEGKVLAIDEHGCVVLKDVVGELTNEILGGAW